MGDDVLAVGDDPAGGISIHVPRMGDDGGAIYIMHKINFYPRPPYGGRPLHHRRKNGHEIDFYPRPPYGGRLRGVFFCDNLDNNFYPRPPYGGRLHPLAHILIALAFLSTSPVWGTTFEVASDSVRLGFYPRPPYGGRQIRFPTLNKREGFYPRPPYGGRWSWRSCCCPCIKVSIHVPRMGDDRNTKDTPSKRRGFYPRPPYGGRCVQILLLLLEI